MEKGEPSMKNKRRIAFYLFIIMIMSIFNHFVLAAPPVIDSPAAYSGIIVPPAPSSLNNRGAWDAAYDAYMDSYNSYLESLGDYSSPYNRLQSMFVDITGHWAENSILYCYDQGLVNIYGDNTARPNNAMSRGEFAYSLDRWITKNQAMLSELGFTYHQNTVTFNDVNPGQPFYQNIISVASKGVMNGSTSMFRPDDDLTRQEASFIWVNLFKMLNNCTMDSSYFNSLNVGSILSRYIDQNEIAAWSREAIAVMTNQNFMTGYPDSTYKPNNIVKRAEMYTILANIERNLKNSKKTTISTPTSTPVNSNDIKLIRVAAKNISSYGFDVEITVNDAAASSNVEAVIAYTTDNNIYVNETNISSARNNLSTRTVNLNNLNRVEVFAHQSIYSTRIYASPPNVYNVYVMLRSGSAHTDVLGCTVYVDTYYPTYTAIPTISPTATPTVTPTTDPSATPTSSPTATPTTTPTATPTTTPATDAELKLTIPKNPLIVGDQVTIVATIDSITITGSSLNWLSNNTSTASVNSSGVVTAVASGTAIISATITYQGTALSADCTVKVADQAQAANNIRNMFAEAFAFMIDKMKFNY